MAKKATSQGADWRSIVADTKNGRLAPVYLLMGDEPYYIDVIVDAFEKNVIAAEDRDFNLQTIYGADATMEGVVASAQQYPFMSDRRLVILKEAQALDKAKQSLDKLEGYVLHPNMQTVLVVAFKGDTLNATSKLMKAAAKSDAVVFKSQKVKDYALAGPVRDYCQQKRVGIDDAAIEMLIAYVGNSLGKIFGEVDKLIIAGGGAAARINVAMIEENIGISKEFNNFELVKAVASKNYPMAMRIVDYFASNPRQNPTPPVVSILFTLFSRLTVALFSSDKSDSALMARLRLNTPYALKDVKEAMRYYNATQAVKAISALREMDTKSKGIGSTQNEHQLLRELIFRLLTI